MNKIILFGLLTLLLLISPVVAYEYVPNGYDCFEQTYGLFHYCYYSGRAKFPEQVCIDYGGDNVYGCLDDIIKNYHRYGLPYEYDDYYWYLNSLKKVYLINEYKEKGV